MYVFCGVYVQYDSKPEWYRSFVKQWMQLLGTRLSRRHVAGKLFPQIGSSSDALLSFSSSKSCHR